MQDHFELDSIQGTWDEFTAIYKHKQSGDLGHLQIIHDFENDFIVTGQDHTGLDVNEVATIEESEEVTPEQIFWLVADVLKAVLCPECSTTNPE